MAEELQALLDRINEEGVKKAEEEREKILAEARREADKTISEAKEKADKIIADAREEEKLLEDKGRQALQQAARDTVLSLRARLQEIMRQVVQQSMDADIDSEQLAEFIREIITAYGEDRVQEGGLEIQVPADKKERIEKYLFSQLAEELKNRVEIAPVEDVSGGFKLSVKDENVEYDFSGEALAEVLCKFLNPRLIEIVKAEFKEDSEQASNK